MTSILNDRKVRLALVGLLVVGAVFASWTLRYVCDDAHISFQYARNLAEGYGLVWQPGDRVEGYTNFLWTVMLAGAMRLGFAPEPVSIGVGLVSLAATLGLGWLLARQILAPKLALAAVALMATNYTLVRFGTGGLETMTQAALVTGMLVVSIGAWQRRRASLVQLAGLSALAAVSILIRPDSVVAAGVCGLALALLVWRRGDADAGRWRGLAALIIPAALMLGAWLAFKWFYYGDLLPNTFYLKTDDSSWMRGLHYVSRFFLEYALFAVLVPLALCFQKLRQRAAAPQAILAAFIGLWLVYVVLVGGDFMGFRFLVSALPALAVLLIWAVSAADLPRVVVGGLVVLVLGASMYAGVDGQRNDIGIYGELGRVLGQTLDTDEPPTIAVATAGAIPYFSRLPAVDMLGLNDRWVARNGRQIDGSPGHQRLASLDYLVQRDVDLVIGTPWLVDRDELQPRYELTESGIFLREDPQAVMDLRPRILEIPIDEHLYLLVMQIGRHSTVEEAIDAHGWGVKPLVHRPDR